MAGWKKKAGAGARGGKPREEERPPRGAQNPAGAARIPAETAENPAGGETQNPAAKKTLPKLQIPARRAREAGQECPVTAQKPGPGRGVGSPGRKNVHREGRKIRQGRRGSRRKRRRIRQGSPGGKENPAEAANQPGERLAGAGKSAGRGTAGERDEGTLSRAAGKRGAGQGQGAEV